MTEPTLDRLRNLLALLNTVDIDEYEGGTGRRDPSLSPSSSSSSSEASQYSAAYARYVTRVSQAVHHLSRTQGEMEAKLLLARLSLALEQDFAVSGDLASRVDADDEERLFWEKVQIDPVDPEGCWTWTGARPNGQDSAGGMIRWQGRRQMAGRIAWLLTYGPLADHEILRRDCKNRYCVKPDHHRVVVRRWQKRPPGTTL